MDNGTRMTASISQDHSYGMLAVVMLRCGMSTYARAVASGAVTLVVFDAIAAFASRSLGFAYARAAIGSYAICLVIGFLIGLDVERRRPMQGVLAGLIMGFADATLGWIVAASLGAGAPHRHLTPITWLIVCWLVMATYTIFTSGGYGIAAFIRKKRLPDTAW